MRALGVSLFLAASTSFAVASPAGPAPILGGTQTTVDQFPTVVVIEMGGGLCTGTLLTKEWILTAAHCISPGVLGIPQAQITASVRVHFGTVNLARSQGTMVTASETIPHPSFNIQALGSHDIGLIKLSTPVTDREPVPVNLVASAAPIGMEVTMVGYGVTAAGGRGSAGVQYTVKQTVVSCASSGGNDANLLCFNQESGTGKCEGDSGGPSFAMIGGKMVQVGITSFGDQECRFFGADTRIDAEKDFLAAHVSTCASDDDCQDGTTCFQEKCILEPFTDTALGADCASDADCESGNCATGSDESHCSMSCTPGSDDACPSGLECIEAGAGGACWPVEKDGCNANGAGRSSTPWLLLGLGLVGLVARRRRA